MAISDTLFAQTEKDTMKFIHILIEKPCPKSLFIRRGSRINLERYLWRPDRRALITWRNNEKTGRNPSRHRRKFAS
jgi:hypothetical protein